MVRALAICMVLLIHAAGPVLSSQLPGESGWWAALLWSGPARMAVPLFFLCSGALLLKRELTPKRIWSHNLPRILCAMFFWAFVYHLADLFTAGTLSPAGIWEALKRTVLFQHEFHFYYLHILLVVYAFLPALGVFVRSATRREEEYLLGVWLAVGILCPALPYFWPFTLVPSIQSWWTLGMSFASVGYALLGHYLRKFGPSIPRKWYAAALGLGVLLTVGGCALMSFRNGGLHELLLAANTPGVCLMAFGLFGLCLSQKNYPRPVSALTGRLARASFCIYLTHVLVQRFLAHFGLTGTVEPCGLFIPITALGMLAGSYLLWEGLHRIPLVRQYLV